jgi:hypothetical protein
MSRFVPVRFAAAALCAGLSPILLATHGGEVTGEFKSDLPGPGEGFTDLLPQGSLAYWEGRFTIPSLESRMLRLRRHRLQKLANMDLAVHWKFCDGVLNYDGRGKNMRTVQEYANFEMYLDWKIPKNGVGAIYLRSSPAIKIWDPSLESLGAEVGSGGLYYNRSGPSNPLAKADNPVGQWNQLYINMVGDRVTVKLNGQLVVDDVVLEDHWNPGAPVPPQGYIELEGSRSPMQFRNIFIRQLP